MLLNKDYVKSILNSSEYKYIKDIFIHESKPIAEKCDINTFLNFKRKIIPFLKKNFKGEYKTAIQHIFNENMLSINVDKKNTINYFIEYIEDINLHKWMCSDCVNRDKCDNYFHSNEFLKAQLIILNNFLQENNDFSFTANDEIGTIIDDIVSSQSIESLLGILKTSYIGNCIGDGYWGLNIGKLLFGLDIITENEYLNLGGCVLSSDWNDYKDSEDNNISISDIDTIEDTKVDKDNTVLEEAKVDNDGYSDIIIDSPALDELHKMIGLNKVKEQISNLYDLLCFRKITANDVTLPDVNLNCIFQGNPGTGKTRTAKLYADILHDAGFIKTNKLICVSASDLIAEHIGGTAIKTTDIIKKSLGGVLFIDEAYQLTPKSEKDFGRECIATLIREMTEHKNDLVIIFAGYKKEMKEFVDVNPGMKSRIANFIDFEDYSIDELYEIFKLNVDNANLKFCDEVEFKLKNIFKNKSKDKTFGNARFVENLFQEMILEHSKNVMKKIRNKELNTSDDSIKVLDVYDIPNVYTSNIT